MNGVGSCSVAHRAGLLPTELTGMWGWILLRSLHQGRGHPQPSPTKQRPGHYLRESICPPSWAIHAAKVGAQTLSSHPSHPNSTLRCDPIHYACCSPHSSHTLQSFQSNADRFARLHAAQPAQPPHTSSLCPWVPCGTAQLRASPYSKTQQAVRRGRHQAASCLVFSGHR